MGSRSSNPTNTNTTSNYYDQRSVTDAGGGIVGFGNSWDQSQNYWQDNSNRSTNFWDASNRSTNNWSDNSQTSWTQNTDSSNRSTNTSNWADNSQTSWTQNTDSSNRSTTSWTDSSTQSWDASNNSTNSTSWTDNSVINVTDGGAVNAMASMGGAQSAAARDIALRAIDAAQESSRSGASAAIAAQQNAIASNDRALSAALGFAQSGAAKAFESSADAMGMAARSVDAVKAAYAGASDAASGNRTLVMVAVGAVALVAAVVILKKKG